jgi:hypothetical protein
MSKNALEVGTNDKKALRSYAPSRQSQINIATIAPITNCIKRGTDAMIA